MMSGLLYAQVLKCIPGIVTDPNSHLQKYFHQELIFVCILCLKKGFVSLRSHTTADSSIFFLLQVSILSPCISGIYKLLIAHLCIYYVILVYFIKTLLSYITKLFQVLFSPSSQHVRSYNCLFHKNMYIHACMYLHHQGDWIHFTHLLHRKPKGLKHVTLYLFNFYFIN